MAKKKIAFVIASLSHGGAERVVSNLCNGLIDKFDIVVITFKTSSSFYTLDDRIKVIACLEYFNIPKNVLQSIKLNYNLTQRIYKILKNESIDMVIGFITSANILGVIAAKAYGIPCVISERNNPLTPGVPKFWLILKNLVYPMADHIILQTEGVKKIFEKRIKESKMSILPNPIASELSILRDEYSDKEKIILTVGRLDKNKNHELIINVFGSMESEGWKLIIIGDGKKKNYLTNLINELELQDKVEIISKVKQIEKYYNKASIFVFTSNSEGFPNALLEAMHFGLPCISSDCNFGPSDLIEDGLNGFLFPINEGNILKEKLLKLIKNKDNIRSKFSKNAKISTEGYRNSKVVNLWEKLINSYL